MGWNYLLQRFIKRLVDVLVAAFGLVALSPLLAALTALVWWFHGWPPTFSQMRLGEGGRPFRLVKFRSMTNETDDAGRPLPDDQRLTPFGRWLRSTSLDELPELWNVLVGDMSLVGPRPLLVHYLPRYRADQLRRFRMPAGITSWSAVNGRNAMSWERKLGLDVDYVDSWSLAFDLRVLWRTVGAVLTKDGISAEGEVTAPEFLGTVAQDAHG